MKTFSRNNRSYGSRSGGFHRGGYRGKRNRFNSPTIDIQKFITKTQNEIPSPVHEVTHTFSDFKLHPQLLQNIERAGFTTPTPIQDQAIEPILSGRDVLGLANTGTGKTAAFLIPIVNMLANDPGRKAVIIAPTRELAIQIEKELRNLKVGFRIWSVLCIGGTSMFRQMQDLRKPFEIVIGTPGRLKDLTERGVLNLGDFQTLVLDEVDRMLDMGFLPDVRHLLSLIQPEKQSLFFSATVSAQIVELINTFLQDHITVSVKTAEVTSQVEQSVIPIKNPENKVEVLVELLKQETFNKVLIFGKTKRGVHKLMFRLREHGFKAESIHGDKSLPHRKRALQDFRENYVNILVATDVAARGIDVPDISHVINFDAPATYEDYVHRIGRTGRANKRGFAVTFVE